LNFAIIHSYFKTFVSKKKEKNMREKITLRAFFAKSWRKKQKGSETNKKFPLFETLRSIECSTKICFTRGLVTL
jgi:hypothetical protein